MIDSTPLDRERTEQLTIRVIALEERPSLIFEENNESFALIDIHLTDVNDNSPVFQPSNLYSFSVNAVAEAGAIIGQVRHERFSISILLSRSIPSNLFFMYKNSLKIKHLFIYYYLFFCRLKQ